MRDLLLLLEIGLASFFQGPLLLLPQDVPCSVVQYCSRCLDSVYGVDEWIDCNQVRANLEIVVFDRCSISLPKVLRPLTRLVKGLDGYVIESAVIAHSLVRKDAPWTAGYLDVEGMI